VSRRRFLLALMVAAKNSRKSTKEGFDDPLKVNWLKEGQVLEIEKGKGLNLS